MVDYDGDVGEVSDEDMQARSYREFKLDKIEENNLKDIEKTINNRNVDAENKEFMTTYLHNLLKKVQRVKQEEHKYEGEENDNVNTYIETIRTLLAKLRTM